MPVEDYFQQGKRWWFRFHEKGGKLHEVPAHHKAEAHVDAWIDAAGIAEETKRPLFRTFGRNGEVTARPLYDADVLRMVKVRGKAIGLPASTCCHTFRATGITAYLENWGTIKKAQAIAAHALPTHYQALRSDFGCAHAGRDREDWDLSFTKLHSEMGENLRRTRSARFPRIR